MSRLAANGRKALNGLGIAVLIAMFMLLLLTQMAQQNVLSRLGALNPPTDYNSAFATIREDEEKLGRVRELRTLVRRQEQALDVLKIEIDAAQVTLETTRSRFLGVARAVRGLCNLQFDEADNSSVHASWHSVLRCAETNDSFPPDHEQELNQIHSSDPNSPLRNLPSQADHLRTLNNRVGYADRLVQAMRAEIEVLQAQVGENRAVRSAFAELAPFRTNWYLGAGILTEFPPSLLRLPLAFVAGAFGALLISLIVAVYPTQTPQVQPAVDTWRAILAGGLIAICIYVVLLGGTAILGTSGRLDAGEGNYMAFTAVCILAGMFSDRAAGWLQERAGSFFSERSGDKGGGQPPQPVDNSSPA